MTVPIIIVWTLIVIINGKPSVEIHDIAASAINAVRMVQYKPPKKED